MNKKALKRTRDLMAKSPSSYDQTKWSIGCGTPGCVAGYAVAANGHKIKSFDYCKKGWFGSEDHIRTRAIEVLDLTELEAKEMFRGNPFMSERLPNAGDAIKMLDFAIEKGVVRWG